MKIQKLPTEALAKLESGIVITDAVRCVLELVYNSLDAKASAITVRVDLKEYKIEVSDNGHGIPRHDLESVGIKYMTNKYNSFINSDRFTTYGYKGQTLACLLDVCESLKIETKTKHSEIVFVKMFQAGAMCNITEDSRQWTGQEGTTITIENFMHSMPVRRKRINEIFDLEEMKLQLKYLALIHYNVSFTLRNENKSMILFHAQCAASVLISVKNMFGDSLAKVLKVVNHKYKEFKVTGLVGEKAQSHYNLQALYVNKRVIMKGVIYKLVNDAMTKYIKQTHVLNNSMAESLALNNLTSARYNVFILEINCSNKLFELFGTAKKYTVEFKEWKDVLKCIQQALKNVFCMNSSDYSSENNSTKIQEKAIDSKLKKGTSILQNAIKGVPARRVQQHSPNNKNFEFLIFNEIMEEYDALESRKTESNQYLMKFQNSTPKKRLKINSKIIESEKNSTFNQFIYWLKTNIETDMSAQNCYQSFLQYRHEGLKRTSSPAESYLESGVDRIKKMKLDVTSNYGDTKTRQKQNEISSTELQPMREYYFCDSKRKQTIETFFCNALEVVPSCSKQIHNLKQNVSNSKNQCDSNRSGSSSYMTKSYRDTEITTVANMIPITEQNYKNNFQINISSPEQTDSFFLNFVNFRNLTESYNSHSVGPHQRHVNYGKINSKTWASHYQNRWSASMDLMEKNQAKLEENLHILESQNPSYSVYINKQKLEEDLSLWLNDSIPEIGEYSVYQHDQINLNIAGPARNAPDNLDLSSVKKDAMVQTEFSFAPETGFETENRILNLLSGKENMEASELAQLNESNLNKQYELINSIDLIEANTLEPENILLDGESRPIYVGPSNEEDEKDAETPLLPSINPTFSHLIDNRKVTVSGEIVCRSQKVVNSISEGTNDSSLSKGTLGAVRTDCVAQIKKGAQGSVDMFDHILNDPISESSELSKTVPLEEIDFDLSSNQQQSFCITNRHNFMPKGLSPKGTKSFGTTEIGVLTPHKKTEIRLAVENSENDLLGMVKWKDDSTGGTTKPVIPDGIVDEMRQKAEKNLLCCENQIPSATISSCAIRVHNLLHPFAFTKELLANVEVIGQLDRKFIVAKMSVTVPRKTEFITLFDQHATDERIKLEELLNEYILADGKFLTTGLTLPIVSELNESLVQVILDANDKLINIGLKCAAVNERTIKILSVPKFLGDKYAKDIGNKDYTSITNTVQGLINNIVQELTETRGALSQIPKLLYNLFTSDACHSAIKFNKPLTKSCMADMINKLKNCKLPFQCAHGRPCVIPIIDLEDFKYLNEPEKINFDKVKKNFISK
ncbi:hypothetical protein RUM43_007216 [Polyplax serrata]|uniref:Uncharacterized protein n=1 Tax=Polyplax serrata TaxID=468196 RepID=A0AAN8PMD1_POLSC